MKAILEFNLPNDKAEYKAATQGMDWALAMWDLSQYIRGCLKYGHSYKDADAAFEAVREKILEICETHKVNLNDME